ncbi:hypothetical protein AAF712_012459 [Marasmius tenuissimus]|uniref:Uncharacterized protein n=1 Tax=Marasmius tenuissimus TaxID=585030 RepID=A0ABR2ZJ37_9AGAR
MNSPEQHYEPEKVLFSEGGATQTEGTHSKTDAEVAEWNFHSHYHQVVHRDNVKCTICRAFLQHCGDGVIDSPESYNKASAERKRFFAHNPELQSKTNELEARLETKQAEYVAVWHQYKAKCRDLEDLERKYRHLLTDFDDTKTELGRVQEELRKITEDSEHQRSGKRRWIDSTVDSSTAPVAMVVDDKDTSAQVVSATPAVFSKENPPWDDVLYRAGKDFDIARSAYEQGQTIPTIGVNGKPLPQRWSLPTTKAEVEQYYVRLKNSAEKGKGSYSLWVFLNRLVKAAKAIPESQRDEAQVELIRAHYIPEFVAERWSSRTGKPSEPNQMPKADVPAPGTSSLSKAAGPVPAKGPKPLSQPPKHSPVSSYAAWGISATAGGKTPVGIKSLGDGSISMRSVRGLHLFYQYSPIHKSGMPAQLRYKYHFTFAELALTRDVYRNYIAQNPLPNSVPATPTPHPGEFNNITSESLAEFLRNQGVSVEKLEDAAYYTALWLFSIEPSNVHAVHERNQLRARVLPSLTTHGLPVGLDDDIYHPDGRIEKRPPTVITDIPGTAQVPGIPSSNSISPIPSSPAVLVEPAPGSATNTSPPLPVSTDADATMTDSTAVEENIVDQPQTNETAT